MDKVNIESGLMGLSVAAIYLNMSKESLYYKARNGEVPCFQLGRIWKFNKEALDKWIKEESEKSLNANL